MFGILSFLCSDKEPDNYTLFNFLRNSVISSLTFFSSTRAYICVVAIFVCPNILLTVSMGTPLESVMVVANVCCFGLDKRNVERTFESPNLTLSRIENPDKNEILEFYRQHWESITEALEHKYFRPLLNTWFRVTLKSQDKTIGFVRLYNTNSSFTGGTSIEYIIDKSYRNKGYATESSLSVINHLRKYSYAISLGGEVNDNNQYSIGVLKNVGFSESKSSTPFENDNFRLSLLDTVQTIEAAFDNNTLKLAIQNKYVEKYERFF